MSDSREPSNSSTPPDNRDIPAGEKRWLTDARLAELLSAVSREEHTLERLREVGEELSEVSEYKPDEGAPISSLEARRRRLTEAEASRQLAAESLEEAREGAETARARLHSRIRDLCAEGMPEVSWVRSGDVGAMLVTERGAKNKGRRYHSRTSAEANDEAHAEARLYRAPWWAIEEAYKRDPSRTGRAEVGPVLSVLRERLTAVSNRRENLFPALLNSVMAFLLLALHIYFWDMLLDSLFGGGSSVVGLVAVLLVLASACAAGVQSAGVLKRLHALGGLRGYKPASTYGESGTSASGSVEEMRESVQRLEKPPCAALENSQRR